MPATIVKHNSPVKCDKVDFTKFITHTPSTTIALNESKRRKTAKELEMEMCAAERAQLMCIKQGKTLTIDKYQFFDNINLYTTEFRNYTLITTRDFTPYMEYAPLDLIKTLQKHWHYGVHVSYGMAPLITRETLNMRVNGGKLLAYKYIECSIEGNECSYYGFVLSRKTDDIMSRLVTHRDCRIAATAIWPRKLYIYLRYLGPCICSSNCTIWSICMKDGETYRSFCIKKIPWSDCYVMMGEQNTDYIDELREPRSCSVCAQCYDCSRKPTYCRKHRVCKHKFKNFTFDETTAATTLKKSSIKSCSKYH